MINRSPLNGESVTDGTTPEVAAEQQRNRFLDDSDPNISALLETEIPQTFRERCAEVLSRIHLGSGLLVGKNISAVQKRIWAVLPAQIRNMFVPLRGRKSATEDIMGKETIDHEIAAAFLRSNREPSSNI